MSEELCRECKKEPIALTSTVRDLGICYTCWHKKGETMDERLKEVKNDWSLLSIKSYADWAIQTIEQQQEKIKWLEMHNLSVQEIIRHSEQKDAEIEYYEEHIKTAYKENAKHYLYK